MHLQLFRFSSQTEHVGHGHPESTVGLLYIDGIFQCFTLEDEKRNIKVFGQTRIPAGRYNIQLRIFGDFHERYIKKFPSFHKGMLWIQNVFNFENILFHTGNDDDDTAGCILLGDSCNNNSIRDGFIGSSTNAYKRVYPKIANYLSSDAGPVFIQIIDYA